MTLRSAESIRGIATPRASTQRCPSSCGHQHRHAREDSDDAQRKEPDLNRTALNDGRQTRDEEDDREEDIGQVEEVGVVVGDGCGG